MSNHTDIPTSTNLPYFSPKALLLVSGQVEQIQTLRNTVLPKGSNPTESDQPNITPLSLALIDLFSSTSNDGQQNQPPPSRTGRESTTYPELWKTIERQRVAITHLLLLNSHLNNYVHALLRTFEVVTKEHQAIRENILKELNLP